MKRKKLLFNAEIILKKIVRTSGRSGIFFAAYNILVHLLKQNRFDIFLYCSPGEEKTLTQIIRSDPLLRKARLLKPETFLSPVRRLQVQAELALLPPTLRAQKSTQLLNQALKKIDLYFSPTYEVPTCIKAQKKLRRFHLIHDMIPFIFPQYYPSMGAGTHGLQILINSVEDNDFFIANSESTRRDFLQYVPHVSADRIVTAPLAVSDRFQPATATRILSTKKRYHIPLKKEYILSVCTLEPRKNLAMIMLAFTKFIEKHKIKNLVLVLVGAAWQDFESKITNQIKNFSKYKDKIIRTGYVEDEDLPPLYSGAKWFVYTSQYEGFGFPPLEAMKCGTPVITSNNSAFPEVVGKAALTISPASLKDHIKAFETYHSKKSIRQANIKKGFQQAQKFSWDRCAKIIADTMMESLEKPLPKPFTKPVLFLIFNRLDTTKKVFEQIRKVKPPRLYIASDAPRPERAGEAAAVAATQKWVLDHVDWPCEVQTLFRKKNLGCKRAVSSAITWFFNQEPDGIILEDDCVPSQSFFWFCSELLDKYRNHPKVGHIAGYTPPLDYGIPESYYFARQMYCWGWASWADRWAHFKADWQNYRPAMIKKMSKRKKFQDHFLHVLNEMKKISSFNSWAYHWAFQLADEGKCCINPTRNLVSNIGFSGTQSLEVEPGLGTKTYEITALVHPKKVAFNDKINEQNYDFMLSGRAEAEKPKKS